MCCGPSKLARAMLLIIITTACFQLLNERTLVRSIDICPDGPAFTEGAKPGTEYLITGAFLEGAACVDGVLATSDDMIVRLPLVRITWVVTGTPCVLLHCRPPRCELRSFCVLTAAAEHLSQGRGHPGRAPVLPQPDPQEPDHYRPAQGPGRYRRRHLVPARHLRPALAPDLRTSSKD
eukprot:SAG22_NODE_657_length_8082_cov_7.277590_1_plen_178_part_00